jgi:hypothetical protein
MPSGALRREVVRVSFDRDRIVAQASRSADGLHALEASAAADSVLARGRHLPGARPMQCSPTRDAAGRPVPRRGWAGPAYTAVCTCCTHSRSPRSGTRGRSRLGVAGSRSVRTLVSPRPNVRL